MKTFLAAAVMLAITGVVSQSVAQTSLPLSGRIESTSPLGADFSGPAASSQRTAIPYLGTANPAPCSTGNRGTAALPTFDGGGINPSTSSTTSGLPAALGATSTPVLCNSVSSSGVTNFPSSSTAATASASSSSSLPSSSPGSSTTTANSGLDTAGLGIAGLGTGGLGTTSLGTMGLGSLPTVSSSSQAAAASTNVAGSPTSCTGTSGTTSSNT